MIGFQSPPPFRRLKMIIVALPIFIISICISFIFTNPSIISNWSTDINVTYSNITKENVMNTISLSSFSYSVKNVLKDSVPKSERSEDDDIVPEEVHNINMNRHMKNRHFITTTNRDLTSKNALASSERDQFWDIYNQRNEVKRSHIYTTKTTVNPKSSGRKYSYSDAFNSPTLTSFKYLLLPIWWREDDQDDPNTAIEVDLDVMLETKQYYRQMSWDKFELSYELLPQQKLNVSKIHPCFAEIVTEAFFILTKMGYLLGDESFDGVMVIHTNAESGRLAYNGGRAYKNGNFLWLSKDVGYGVVRHEIGHNFGHLHHRSMRGYRENPNCECDGYDGFDMMSGGNNYAVSHFALASKWFYNWVPDSAIIMMQPEGPTTQCPKCLSEGTFKLFAFDRYDHPPQWNETMGIQIPIMGTDYDSTMFAYWLSYRSGVDGHAAVGLSVHLAWFHLGGLFGAHYDSISYDANGATESVFDSFVLPGTCYIIYPSVKLKEMESVSVENILPKVCVDSIHFGLDITVSVSFLTDEIFCDRSKDLNKNNEELICSSNSAMPMVKKFDSASRNLIHISGAGNKGNVTVGLCTTGADNSSFISAYVYDRYPYSPLVLGEPYGYTAFSSFKAMNCCDHGSEPNAKTVSAACTSEFEVPSLIHSSTITRFNDSWIIITPNPEANEIMIEAQCQILECPVNTYMSDGVCERCPNGISEAGSIRRSDCTLCSGGYEASLTHQRCELSDSYDINIIYAIGWRIWVPVIQGTNSSTMNVNFIEFYSKSDCNGARIDPIGTIIDSGNHEPNWPQRNPFNYAGQWSGNRDMNDAYWLGIIYTENKAVQCVRFDIDNSHDSYDIRVQAYIIGRWRNVWIEKNITKGRGSFGWTAEFEPSSSPSVDIYIESFTPTPSKKFQPFPISSNVSSVLSSNAPSMENLTLIPSVTPTITFPPSTAKPRISPLRPFFTSFTNRLSRSSLPSSLTFNPINVATTFPSFTSVNVSNQP